MTEGSKRRPSARKAAQDVLVELAGNRRLSAVHRIRAARAALSATKAARRPERPDDGDQADTRAAEIAAAPTIDGLPVIAEHRGFPIFDFQTESRISTVVRPDIDQALALDDPEALLAFARDPGRAPESRLAAAARFRAMDELRVAAHVVRIGGFEKLDAATAGLASLNWADPDYHCSLLDVRREPVPRRPADQRDRLLAAQGGRTADL